jgi:CheY-like chemotaxis protein
LETLKQMNKQILTILLVEDNEDDIVLIKECLIEAKLINLIHVVKNGEEALLYLRGEDKYKGFEQPGLVLMDINMPRKNGFEALHEIKADPALAHIPVIILTVSASDEDVVRSYSEGACTFIRKPVNFERFKTVINELAVYWALVATIPKRG